MISRFLALLLLVVFAVLCPSLGAAPWVLVNGTPNGLIYTGGGVSDGVVVPAHSVVQVSWPWTGNFLLRAFVIDENGTADSLNGGGQWVDGGDVPYYFAVVSQYTIATGAPVNVYSGGYKLIYRQDDSAALAASGGGGEVSFGAVDKGFWIGGFVVLCLVGGVVAGVCRV